MAKHIPLRGKYGIGKFAVVDDTDFEGLSQFRWYVTVNGYVARGHVSEVTGKRTALLMHRNILNPTQGLHTDHIDGNKLNNQRSNLRLCTQAENNRNLGKKNNRSRFKGIKRDKRRNKWVAQITVNYQTIHLGQFDSDTEAAKVYDAAAVKYFGEFARTNFPISETAGLIVEPKTLAKRKTSRFKGVSKLRDSAHWRARIVVNSRVIDLGCFPTEGDAARAYNNAEATLLGRLQLRQ